MERANEAAALSALLHREWSLPHDPGRLRVQTERLARDGKIVVCESHGVSVAMSCEVASTGNYVHVGTTVTEPAFRRRGHAAACVCAVLTRARAAGRAERGGVLFTNALNVGAIALYERLGFVREAEWELCFMAAPTSAVTADELSRPR